MYSVVLLYHGAFEDTSVENLDWNDMDCKILMTAATTKEEIVKILKMKPDMIFICTIKRDKSIFKITEELMKDLPDTVISIISSVLEFDFVKAAMNAGVVQYISLPVDEPDFKISLDVMKRKALNVRHGDKRSRQSITESNEQTDNEVYSFAVRNAMAYIEANYKNKITLDDVAEDIYISKWHLSKLLNKYIGKSFSDIVNGYRIEDAKMLLKDPSHKISTIAELSGFKDGAHFSHVFKRMTGMTPIEYKNRLLDTKNVKK